MLRRPIPLAILIGLASWGLFLIRLAVPHQPVFDETHYVPAARIMATLAEPANIEHPLLAKELMAIGVRLFGDNSFGWRFMSTLAGAATVVSVFAILQLMIGRVRSSLFGALLTLLGFTVYVQARIAMLDTFMLAFLIAGIAVIAWGMRRGGWWRWALGAMLLGAAVACKWGAAPYVAFAAIAFVALKREDAKRWPGVAIVPGVAVLGVASIATYFLTFVPAFFYANQPMTLAELIPFQLEMYARQTASLPPHTYQSNWWTWPFMIRPIWYLYEPADGAQRGILLIGNPAVMWGGLIALAACVWGWIKTGSPRLFAAAGLWLGSVAIWALIPKSLGFYYYYYPSSVFIVIAIVTAFDHWHDRLKHWDEAFVAAALVLAIYFFPVLSAQALPDAGAFRNWTWFSTWV